MKNPDRSQNYSNYVSPFPLNGERTYYKSPGWIPVVALVTVVAGAVFATMCSDFQKRNKPGIASKVVLTDPELDRDLNCLLERFNQLCTGVINTDWVIDNCDKYMGAYPLMDELTRVVPFRGAVLDKAGNLDGLVGWSCDKMDTPDANVVQTVNNLDKLSSEQRKSFKLR